MQTREDTMPDRPEVAEDIPNQFRGRSYERFSRRLRGRLEEGAVEYGDMSFGRPVAEIVGEIEEELLDVAGWAWVAWETIQHLKRRGLGK